jgi:hypothetical protein
VARSGSAAGAQMRKAQCSVGERFGAGPGG